MAISLFGEVKQVFRSFRKAHHFLFSQNRFLYFLPPVLFNLLLWMLIGILLFYYTKELSAYLLDLLGSEKRGDNGLLIWLTAFVLLWFIRSMIIFFFLLIYKYIITLILGPYLSYLTKKVFISEGMHAATLKKQSITYSYSRNLVVHVRVFTLEFLISVLISTLFVFTPLLPFIPFFGFLLGAYFFGYTIFDIVLHRLGIDRRKAANWIWSNKIASLLTGSFFYLGVIIPGAVALLPLSIFHGMLQVYILIPVFAFSIFPVYCLVAAAYVVLEERELGVNEI